MKTVKILLFTLLTFGVISSAHASIGSVEATTTQTIEVKLINGTQVSEEEVEGDFKILKDLSVTFSSKDFNDNKKVIVTLGEDIQAQSTYSLLSVYGVDGNIDFTVGEEVEGFEFSATVSPLSQGINKVKVSDSRTLELYFNQEIEEEEFEFKVFSEVEIAGLEAINATTFAVKTVSKLQTSSDYIFMVLALKDFLGTDITLDEDFFELMTSAELADADNEEEVNELEELEKEIEQLELNAAEEEEEGNMDEVAIGGVEETPDTGASTNVLILLTLLVNGFLLARKKFSK